MDRINRKLFLWLIILCLLLSGCGKNVCKVCGKDHVIHAFAEEIGLPDEIITYSLIINTYGSPDSVAFDHKEHRVSMYIYYDKLTFCFGVQSCPNDDPSDRGWRFENVACYDPTFDFGNGISVGRTKKSIMRIFSRAEPVKEAEKGTAYWNDRAWLSLVLFVYDENDIVTGIKYCTELGSVQTAWNI